jgi:glutamate decarboxylase
LPKHLIFELHYLGGTEESYTLSFSRPGAQIIAQYYNLIHLGFNGYREIMESTLSNARLLSKALEATGWYICVSDIHRKKGEHSFKGTKEPVFGKENETSADYNAGLPVVAFRFSHDFQNQYPHVHQESVSTLLRIRQYIVPSKPIVPFPRRTPRSIVAALNAVSSSLPITELFIFVSADTVFILSAAVLGPRQSH